MFSEQAGWADLRMPAGAWVAMVPAQEAKSPGGAGSIAKSLRQETGKGGGPPASQQRKVSFSQGLCLPVRSPSKKVGADASVPLLRPTPMNFLKATTSKKSTCAQRHGWLSSTDKAAFLQQNTRPPITQVVPRSGQALQGQSCPMQAP